MPIYNANHLFGFLSVFNPSAVKTVKLYKGGFPARFGGRLSSVVDINMKEGNMKEFKGEASVGLISSRMSLEGPIIKDKTSFIVSGRRTYVDLLTRPLFTAINRNKPFKNETGYFFYDLNVKVNHKFSDKSRLYLSGYWGSDEYWNTYESYWIDDHIRYDNNYKNGISWGNGNGSLRWNYLFSNKLFSNASLTYSKYNYKVLDISQFTNTKNETFSRESFNFNSGIEDITAKVDFDYLPNPNHSIKFGANFTYHSFSPGANRKKIVDQINDSLNADIKVGNKDIHANEFNVYGEDIFDIGSRLKANLGIHLTGFDVDNSFYFSLQPRASFRFKASEKIALKASYARMSQNVHLLSTSTISLPTDLWLPTTNKVKPQNSHQFSVGTFIKLPKGFDLTVEAYYKNMDNLIEYFDGASVTSADKGWEEQIELGKGWSYGAEVLIEKKVGNTTGWIGYTWSKTERQFPTVNKGKIFPARYDRRHDLSISLAHTFNDQFDIGATWVYGTGNAVTLGTQTYKAFDKTNYYNNGHGQVTYYESRNNFRMPEYHRLDIGANFHKRVKLGMRTWSFSVYNIYNRQNPFYLFWDENMQSGYDNETGWYYEQKDPALKQQSLFPFIPSVSYTLKF